MLVYKENLNIKELLNEKRLKKVKSVDLNIKKEFEKGNNLVIVDRQSFFFINNCYYLLQDDLDD